MNIVTVNLPESFSIASAKDAPEEYRVVKLDKWTEQTVLDAVEFAISERLGNVWSVGKKDVSKMKDGHESLEDGNWNAKIRGSKGFVEKLTGMDAANIWKLLSPQQQAALLAQGGNIQSLTLSGK